MRYGGVTVTLRYYTVITIITLRYGKIRPVTRNATTLPWSPVITQNQRATRRSMKGRLQPAATGCNRLQPSQPSQPDFQRFGMGDENMELIEVSTPWAASD